MGCGEECPLVPGVERDDWSVPDPKDEPIEQVRQIRDQIRKCVSDLIRERKW
jgi:arsenate reductase